MGLAIFRAFLKFLVFADGGLPPGGGKIAVIATMEKGKGNDKDKGWLMHQCG